MTRTNRFFINFFVCILVNFHFLKAQENEGFRLTTIGTEAFEVMRQIYDYDKHIPLEVSKVVQTDEKEYVKEKILFQGHRSLVPGYLAVSKYGTAPYPVVLLIHGVTSSKESWWEKNSIMGNLTEQLLNSGYAVLTLDAEYHGERSINNPFESPLSIIEKEWFVMYRDMIIESVIDYRRAMDYLETRKDIDASKIGIVGYSMGGMMTFILSAIDNRIDASVSCVSPIITVPYLPTAIQNFAPYIKNTSFLMLMGKNDDRNYTIESSNQLYKLVGSNTKNLVFFDSGHMLPYTWIDEAKNWLVKYLQ